ncbi:linoleate 13S-lipoxygenase 2-1, chloroplastic-like protein, partial [Tanacetum coccineum]
MHKCSYSVLRNHSIENFNHKQPKFVNTEIEIEQSDVYECDPKESDTIIHDLSVRQELEYEILLVVPEHECDLQTPHASTKILLVMQGNVSGFNGDNQPNEPQGSVVIFPSMETYDYFTSEESGRDLEFCVQDPSKSNSRIILTEGKYIGRDIEESWKVEPAIKVAFEKFKGRLKKIEDIIDKKNENFEE